MRKIIEIVKIEILARAEVLATLWSGEYDVNETVSVVNFYEI